MPLVEWIHLGHHASSPAPIIAFVIGLLSQRARSPRCFGVITAFTLAHSIHAGARGSLSTSCARRRRRSSCSSRRPSRGSASRTSCSAGRSRGAFVFGLVHGLQGLRRRELLAGETRRLLPLVGFNLGVETGQLMLVAAMLALLWMGRRVLRRGRRRAKSRRLSAPRVVRTLSRRPVSRPRAYSGSRSQPRTYSEPKPQWLALAIS